MTGRLRVLMVDDQPILHEAVRQMLVESEAAEIDVEFISDPRLAIARALVFEPAVVLLDINMDPLDGLQVLRQIRAHPRLTDIAVVMLSTAEEPVTKAEAFRCGANDYVVKLPSAIELTARLRYHARASLARRERESAFAALLQSRAELAAQNQRIEEQKRQLQIANRDLEQASLTDALTGLRNRRYLKRFLEEPETTLPSAAVSERRHVDPAALCFYLFDLDHFKQINDRYGHDAGDTVLIEVARRLTGRLRQTDAILRWGGEEFLVIGRGLDRGGALELARSILDCIGGEPVALSAQVSLHVTCSVGCAPLPWRSGSGARLSLDQVLSLADAAIYLGKSAGRNRAHAVFPGTDADFVSRLKGLAISPELLLAEDGRGVELRRCVGGG